MELIKSEVKETSYTGKEKIILDGPNGRLKLQRKLNSGGMEDFLDETVPSGKRWSVIISVNILEEDV